MSRYVSAVPAVSYAKRLTDLAIADPDRVCLTVGADQITRADFDRSANRLARDLAGRGVTAGAMVTIALPNSIEWFVSAAACWKFGAIPQPVSSRLPPRELQAIIELAEPALVIGVDDDVVATLGMATQSLPVRLPRPGRSRRQPAARRHVAGVEGTDVRRIDRSPEAHRQRRPVSPRHRRSGPVAASAANGCLVMPGPLYHNGPIVWSCQALVWGDHVVVLPRFDAEATLEAIQRPPGRHRLPRPHDDEAHLAPARRDPLALRHVVAARRMAPGRAVPAVAEAGVDRLARARAHLRAVRRHRGPGGHDHHRRRSGWRTKVRSASRSGRHADPRRRRATSSRSARWARCGCARRATRRPTATSGPRPVARRRLGVARRHGLARRGRLPLPRRPSPGHDPLGGLEHLPGRGRSRHPGAPGRAVVRGHRPARRRHGQHACTRSSKPTGDGATSRTCWPSSANGSCATRSRARSSTSTTPLRDDAGKVRRAALRADRLPAT